MTLNAIAFVITSRDRDLVALAVLCVDARYFSTITKRLNRPTRHFVTPAQWKELQHQIAMGLPAQVFPSDNPIAVLLADRVEPQTVSWLGTTPIAVERPEDAARALDRHLRVSLQAYRPGLRLEQTKKERRGSY